MEGSQRGKGDRQRGRKTKPLRTLRYGIGTNCDYKTDHD